MERRDFCWKDSFCGWSNVAADNGRNLGPDDGMKLNMSEVNGGGRRKIPSPSAIEMIPPMPRFLAEGEKPHDNQERRDTREKQGPGLIPAQ